MRSRWSAHGAVFSVCIFLVTLAGCVSVAASVHAQTFDVPDGFVSHIERSADGEGTYSTRLRVSPTEGAFASLSTIELEPLTEEIADPVKWLHERVVVTMGSPLTSSSKVLESPDSPFDDPMFERLRDMIEGLRERFAELGKMPLEFCDDVRQGQNQAGEYSELPCTFELGPLHQYLYLRLQQIDDLWYYTRISTMNKRRLRHLVAIANSFHVD